MVNKDKIIQLLTRATIRRFLHYSCTQELNKKMAFFKKQIDIFNGVKIYISTFKKITKLTGGLKIGFFHVSTIRPVVFAMKVGRL